MPPDRSDRNRDAPGAELLEYPLQRWSRPLIAAERRVDILSDLEPIDIAAAFRVGEPGAWDPCDRDRSTPGYFATRLPPDIPQCGLCGVPSCKRVCGGCARLLDRH